MSAIAPCSASINGRAPETSVLIITSPEPEPVQEAIFLAQRLASADMTADAQIVNRTHLDGLGGPELPAVCGLL